MNIVHPGDHVVLVVPSGFSSTRAHEHFNKMMAQIPELMEAGPHPVQFILTSLAVGAVDSTPSVLFVIRKP